MDKPFRDRGQAGKRLAQELRRRSGHDSLVLTTPGPSAVVASEVARALGAELDVFLVRPIYVPLRDHVSMAAVVSGGTIVLHRDVIAALKVDGALLEDMAGRELVALLEQEHTYRAGRPPLEVVGRNVIFVDDGLTPTSELRAVLAVLAADSPARLTAALPITTPANLHLLTRMASDITCAVAPEPFHREELWYRANEAPSEREICALLDVQSHRLAAIRAFGAGGSGVTWLGYEA